MCSNNASDLNFERITTCVFGRNRNLHGKQVPKDD